MFKHLLILALIMVVLSGCDRPADGQFNPVRPADSTPIAGLVTETSTPDDPVVVTPTEILAEAPTDSQPSEEAPLIVTLAPTQTNTPEPADPTATIEPIVTDFPLTETFITPGAPLNPLLGTETAALPTDTPENGLRATPTQFDPNSTPEPEETDSTPERELSEDQCLYVVLRGDSLYRIGLIYDVTVAQIREVNPAIPENDTIFPGQELIIPNCEPTPTPDADRGTVHIVRSGETLSTIAERYGVTMAAILRANNLTNPDRLSIGQELIIPPDND
ncbi:MAG: LysM peptidoglycan-binding domain-containing protein [Anaerolineae bacterium]|jgi:LysM repeat protein|nr:LysM peptidoglycan-binding domain-containing protein [Anaerolineae bacterium]